MRATLALAALTGVAAAFCDSKDGCLAQIRAASTSPVAEVAGYFAELVLDAHDWEHHSQLTETTDSLWCANNS